MYCAQTEVDSLPVRGVIATPARPSRVTLGHRLPRDDLLREDFQLLDQHRGLNGIEPAGHTNALRIVFVGRALAMDAEAFHARGQFIIVGEYRAAVAITAKRLGREEAGRRCRRQLAKLAAAIERAERLRGVIEHQQAVPFGNRSNSVVIGRQAEQIDRDDRTRFQPSRLCGRNRAFQACRIDVEGVRLDVGENRRRTEQRDLLRRRMECEGRTDHGIAGADLPRQQHQQQGVSATGASDDVLGAAECRKVGFESANFRALNELAMREHTADSVVDRTAQTAALSGNIDKRNGLVVDAHVLIHFLLHTLRRLTDNAPRTLALWRA